jgi:hypothetical protein
VKFIPTVSRVNRGKTHWYVDGNGVRIPGVTTVLGAGLPKPQLVNWSGNATAEAAINRWDELSNMPPAQRLETLKRARYEVTNTAKNKGTQIHLYAEALVQGIEVKGVPDELRPYVENYVNFIDAWQLDPVLVEVVIVSYSHGYAGTLDLVADLTGPTGERERYLLDIKTGEKGIYAETALQLAAYRFSEFYVDADGNEQPMIGVDNTAAIHVTADDAQLIPTVSGQDQLNMFRIAQKIYEYDKDKDGLILPALQLPTTSKAHVVWDKPDD